MVDSALRPFDDSSVHSEPKGELEDQYGRVARDLRVSLTDRCNFRCTYCMPADGMQWLARSEILTRDELLRIVSLLVDAGITSIRLTGGEPLVRSDIVGVVQDFAHLELDSLAMTTNGTRLESLAGQLRAAGLHRLNISIDSLQRERFALITRRDEINTVLAGIDAARTAGFEPIKINCVLMRNVNEDELLDFASFAQTRNLHVRFIEPMPLDGDHHWKREQVVPASEIIERISDVYPLAPNPAQPISSPATEFVFADGAPGSIGVIGSVSDPFCKTCDRLRLTAEGQLRTCLFADVETDLRTPLRDGVTDHELRSLVMNAVFEKQAGHGINNVDFRPPRRNMSSIGG